MFVSGAIAVLHLCNEVYNRFRGVRRYASTSRAMKHARVAGCMNISGVLCLGNSMAASDSCHATNRMI